MGPGRSLGTGGPVAWVKAALRLLAAAGLASLVALGALPGQADLPDPAGSNPSETGPSETGPIESGLEGQYIKVEVRGVMRHAVPAVGGESTGTDVTSRGITWELDLGARPDLLGLAERLHGKQVLVSGNLSVIRGLAAPWRWVVAVSELRPAEKIPR